MPQSTSQNVIQLRKIQRQKKEKIVHILTALGLTLVTLFLIIGYAAIRAGGFDKLLSGGSGNLSQNIVDNIVGTTPTPTPTATPTLFIVEVPIENREELILSRNENTLVFSSIRPSYDITIKKGSKILMINDIGKPLALLFSDGRRVRLENRERIIETFNSVGTLTFKDEVDNNLFQLTGKITIVE